MYILDTLKSLAPPPSIFDLPVTAKFFHQTSNVLESLRTYWMNGGQKFSHVYVCVLLVKVGAIGISIFYVTVVGICSTEVMQFLGIRELTLQTSLWLFQSNAFGNYIGERGSRPQYRSAQKSWVCISYQTWTVATVVRQRRKPCLADVPTLLGDSQEARIIVS